MPEMRQRPSETRLSGEGLSFWWFDSPMQPTTMALLMVLDRAPDASRLQWEFDPTFDLDYHVRRHVLSGRADMDELFREIGPAYETPFDRTRPLWEARIYDGLGADGHPALFFKLHHAVADGVGGNAIFAAMTDPERDPAEQPPGGMSYLVKSPWPQRPLGARLLDTIRDRVELDLERARAELLAAYPFAPVAMKSPVSVALYGYRDRLFIGLDSDEALMLDVEAFEAMIAAAFEELRDAVAVKQSGRREKRAAPRSER